MCNSFVWLTDSAHTVPGAGCEWNRQMILTVAQKVTVEFMRLATLPPAGYDWFRHKYSGSEWENTVNARWENLELQYLNIFESFLRI